jgi:hypothetical protein
MVKECQHGEQIHIVTQVLLAMTKVVLKVVTLIF